MFATEARGYGLTTPSYVYVGRLAIGIITLLGTGRTARVILCLHKDGRYGKTVLIV